MSTGDVWTLKGKRAESRRLTGQNDIREVGVSAPYFSKYTSQPALKPKAESSIPRPFRDGSFNG